MRRQTRFTAVHPATWKRVYERDGGRCVLCGCSGVLQAAHFIGRAQGGLGREKNLVMLCPVCHGEYDQSERRKEIRPILREYLQGLYDDWDETELVYRKGME